MYPIFGYTHFAAKFGGILVLVGVTKTEPLRELVWNARKDPDHERQKVRDGENASAMASAPILS